MKAKAPLQGAFTALAGVMVLSWNPFMAWMQGMKTIK